MNNQYFNNCDKAKQRQHFNPDILLCDTLPRETFSTTLYPGKLYPGTLYPATLPRLYNKNMIDFSSTYHIRIGKSGAKHRPPTICSIKVFPNREEEVTEERKPVWQDPWNYVTLFICREWPIICRGGVRVFRKCFLLFGSLDRLLHGNRLMKVTFHKKSIIITLRIRLFNNSFLRWII